MRGAKGFSLIEVMLVMAVFMVVSGAVFSLLGSAQVRYRSEQQLVEALQGARIGLDVLTRDIHRAGYPPINSYDRNVTLFAMDVANGYPARGLVAVRLPGMVGTTLSTVCLVDTDNPGAGASTCDLPNPYELLIETDIDPDNQAVPEQVEWIYYRVAAPGTPHTSFPPDGGGNRRTLYRMVSDKKQGADPRASGTTKYRGIASRLVPMIEDVMNDPAGGADQWVFRYVCTGGVTVCAPGQIQEIHVELRVQTRSPNLLVPATGGMLNYRTVTLRTVARPINP